MSCEHDFRLEGIRQVYIDDELVGSIDYYKCLKCGAIELVARKLGEDTEQTYGFKNYSDKWYLVFDNNNWEIVRESNGQIVDIDGKNVDINGKTLIEINSPKGEIKLRTK